MDKLDHVHPDLVKVVLEAQQHAKFIVVYGLRTLEAQQQAVATGHSTTMKSRHLPNAEGLSCAVDLAHVLDGRVDWATGHEAQVYGEIAGAMKDASAKLGIPIEWGGDWHSFKDWGHFQLPWKEYP